MRGAFAVKNYAVDDSGFIVVRGQRVNGSGNKPVKFRGTCSVHCQRCKNLNIVCKMGVFMRYETAFNAPFYWCGIVGNIPRYCSECYSFTIL